MKLKNILLSVLIVAIYVLGLAVTLVVEPIQIKNMRERCTYETVGTVIDVKTKAGDDDSETKFYVIYEFEMDGVTYKQIASLSKEPDVGDKHSLMINPNNAEDFYNPSIVKKNLIKSISIGIIMLLVGAFVLMLIIRTRKAENAENREQLLIEEKNKQMKRG